MSPEHLIVTAGHITDDFLQKFTCSSYPKITAFSSDQALVF